MLNWRPAAMDKIDAYNKDGFPGRQTGPIKGMGI
jgi:hypothetical protein